MMNLMKTEILENYVTILLSCFKPLRCYEYICIGLKIILFIEKEIT